MRKRMYRVLGKIMAVTGSLVLSLSPVYATGQEDIQETSKEVVTDVALEPSEVTFDRSKDGHIDIYTNVNLYRGGCEGLSYNGKNLREGREFYIGMDGGKERIILLQSFLKSLPLCKSEIVFNFRCFDDIETPSCTESKVLTVNAIDSSLTSEVEVSCEKNQYQSHSFEYFYGIPILVHVKGDKLLSISNKGNELELDHDYSIDKINDEGDMTVTLDRWYVEDQDEGTMELTFDFESGIRKTLAIELLPANNTAELRELEDVCDWSKEKPMVQTLVVFNNNDLLSMTNNGKKLIYEEDYTVGRTMDSMYIWFTEKFLKTLPEGKNEVLFNFDKTDPITFTINVINKKSDMQLSIDKTTEAESNTIGNSFKFIVDGEQSYDLSKLKVRYYYTADDEAATQNVAVDNAAISYIEAPWYESIADNVQAEIVKMEASTDTADTYLELSFTSDATLNNKSVMTVDTRINKSDWSNYDQSNDFSYGDASKVAVFYDGTLISGSIPK